MNPTLTAYCFPWHITSSPAFQHLLVDPLTPFLSVEFNAPPDLFKDTDEPLPTTKPIIFCQRLPFPAWLADKRARIVWIPMWDQVYHFDQAWWDALPKTLRIVAFSDEVETRAQKAGLKVKLNTVAVRGFNDHEVDDLIQFCQGSILLVEPPLVKPGNFPPRRKSKPSSNRTL